MTRTTPKYPLLAPTAALGGSSALLAEIESATMDALQPQSSLQGRRVRELAALELELEQHRSMRDTRLYAEARDLAEGYLTHGSLAPPGDERDPEARRVAAELFGDDAPRAKLARAELENTGVSIEELLALAYQRLAATLAEHEKRIASLEKRRREQYVDYEDLRVIEPRVRRNG